MSEGIYVCKIMNDYDDDIDFDNNEAKDYS